jgi:hypothetical protein
MSSLSFFGFINESYIRGEIVDIWNIFSEVEREADGIEPEELDQYLYQILTSLRLRVADPLSLYGKFKRLVREYRAGHIELDEALYSFTDSANVLMFENSGKKI